MALNLTNVWRRMPQWMYRRPSSGEEIREYIIESRTEPERNPNYQPNVNKWNQLVTNKNLANFIPNNGNPIINVDKYKTKEDLMNQQIGLLEWEAIAQKEWQSVRNAQQYIDSYWNANNGANDKLRNRNMDTLKWLWISMDDVRAEYFRRHPTPQMEARDRVQTAVQSQATNNDTQIQEAKRLITNELKRMNAAWELTKDVSRTQKLIDLYKKLK